MEKYCVLYREDSSIESALDHPLIAVFDAEDSSHAEEQMLDYLPDCIICWVVETDNINAALYDYYNQDQE